MEIEKDRHYITKIFGGKILKVHKLKVCNKSLQKHRNKYRHQYAAYNSLSDFNVKVKKLKKITSFKKRFTFFLNENYMKLS